MEALEHLALDRAGHGVQAASVQGVRHLHMDGADGGVGAVVVQDQVVGAEHARDLLHTVADLAGDFAVGAAAEDVADGVEEHLKARLEDEAGDDRADDAVKVELEDQVDDRADQRRGGDDGVEACVRAGGDERFGVVLLALGLDIAAQDELDHHGHRRGCRAAACRRCC